MRIGLDGRHLSDQYPGIGRYIYNLARALRRVAGEEELQVFTYDGARDRRYRWEELAGPGLSLQVTSSAPRSLSEQLRLPLLLRSSALHLYHAPYYIFPYLWPGRAVVTIHDAIPSSHPEELAPRERWLYRLFMVMALRRARLVLTDSEAAAQELSRHFGVPRQRLRPVPLAADEFALAPAAPAAPEANVAALQPYLLTVGINKPHKNLRLLVRTLARLRTPARLVVAGPRDRRYASAAQLAAEAGVEERVLDLGPVDEPLLRALYWSATIFVFPSLAEGFGLPVLEAMAAGLPIVAADIPVMREVTGDAALLLPPHQEDTWAEALGALLTSPAQREELRQRALSRAQLFSWERTARMTLAVYHEALAP